MWKHVFIAIQMIKELNKQKQKNVLQLTLWAFQCISEEKHAFFCWPFLKGHPFIGRSRISIFLLSWQLLQCEKTFSCPSIPLQPLSSAHWIQFELSKVTDVKYIILQISCLCYEAFYNFTKGKIHCSAIFDMPTILIQHGAFLRSTLWQSQWSVTG